MASASPSEVKLEIGHVLFIDIVRLLQIALIRANAGVTAVRPTVVLDPLTQTTF